MQFGSFISAAATLQRILELHIPKSLLIPHCSLNWRQFRVCSLPNGSVFRRKPESLVLCLFLTEVEGLLLPHERARTAANWNLFARKRLFVSRGHELSFNVGSF